jgi:hypothetical protein
VIISKIRGGLGNQLFNYAAGRHLATLHAAELLLDASWYRGGGRPLMLKHFRIAGRITEEDQSGAADGIGFNQTLWHYYPEFAEYSGRKFLSGRWQSERFFAPAAALIREDLRFADPDLETAAGAALARLAKGRARPLVAVHCRRGDFVPLSRERQFTLLGPGYYAAARALFAADCTFVLFSDDPAWCRANLADARTVLCDVGDALLSFAMMRQCEHHIIANSSFSWWAAWLAETPRSRIIAPDSRKWFGPDLLHEALRAPIDTREVVPERWTQLPVDG